MPDGSLPDLLTRAADAAAERIDPSTPGAIRRQGDRRHRRRTVVLTTSAVLALALTGAVAVQALMDDRRSGPPPVATQSLRPTAPTTKPLPGPSIPAKVVPPGTRLRSGEALLLKATDLPLTPARRPWRVMGFEIAGDDINCRGTNDWSAVRSDASSSHRYTVPGRPADSASERVYETASDQAAMAGFRALLREPRHCPGGGPPKRPGRELRGNGGVGQIWATSTERHGYQSFAGVGYKANIVVVIEWLAHPRPGVPQPGPAAAERMLLNAFARIG